MSPRTRQALIVAGAAVGIAAIGGIAAIEGWLPDGLSGDPPPRVSTSPGPRIAGTAPPESLSPGESIVPPPLSAEPASPPPAAPVPPSKPCPHCGTVSSTTFHDREPRNARWEVRVRFDDGSRKVMRFPTDPGFRVGERVTLLEGRLRKE